MTKNMALSQPTTLHHQFEGTTSSQVLSYLLTPFILFASSLSFTKPCSTTHPFTFSTHYLNATTISTIAHPLPLSHCNTRRCRPFSLSQYNHATTVIRFLYHHHRSPHLRPWPLKTPTIKTCFSFNHHSFSPC